MAANYNQSAAQRRLKAQQEQLARLDRARDTLLAQIEAEQARLAAEADARNAAIPPGNIFPSTSPVESFQAQYEQYDSSTSNTRLTPANKPVPDAAIKLDPLFTPNPGRSPFGGSSVFNRPSPFSISVRGDKGTGIPAAPPAIIPAPVPIVSSPKVANSPFVGQGRQIPAGFQPRTGEVDWSKPVYAVGHYVSTTNGTPISNSKMYEYEVGETVDEYSLAPGTVVKVVVHPGGHYSMRSGRRRSPASMREGHLMYRVTGLSNNRVYQGDEDVIE